MHLRKEAVNMNEKIMVVDDEKGVVTIMKNYFEMSG